MHMFLPTDLFDLGQADHDLSDVWVDLIGGWILYSILV